MKVNMSRINCDLICNNRSRFRLVNKLKYFPGNSKYKKIKIFDDIYIGDLDEVIERSFRQTVFFSKEKIVDFLMDLFSFYGDVRQ
ncbi:hypothetical protein [Clostridium folliculivorans]|nr:hypothetical protein [Clostridium folliculivorans]